MKSKNYLLLALILLVFNQIELVAQVALKPKNFRSYDSKNISSSQAQKIIKSEFLKSANVHLKQTSVDTDHIGIQHISYQANYNGIPIEFGKYTLHEKDGKINSISGMISPINPLGTEPSIPAEEAFEELLKIVNARKYIWEEIHKHEISDMTEKPKGELMILPYIEGIIEEPALVYKFSILATEPLIVADYYIHAHTGELIFKHNKLCNADVPADGNSIYNGPVNFTASTYNSGYRLLNSAATLSGLETRKFDLISGNIILSPIESATTTFIDQGAVQAHWGAEKTLSYFQQKHLWDSYDNNGSLMNIVANAYGSSYTNNAFWFNNRAWFGQGDGTTYNNFAAIDVVGHEITHGVVQNSANLIYQNESGALNESFADIFGEEIELDATGQRDWIVGEQVKIGANLGLRSFANPSSYNMPDTYYGQYYVTSSFDNGGVHFNSSVQNHWFYILSNGQSGINDFNNSYNVTAIGAEKASLIAFRNLTYYLTPNSGFFDARAGSIQAAKDLYGVGSPEEIAVTNAWYAVGVGNEYGNNTQTSCLSNGPLTLRIDLDDAPEDIGWHLRRNTDQAILQFVGINTYGTNLANTTVNANLGTLGNGSYKLNFYDISRNGLAPNGSFSLLSGGNVVAQSAPFDLSESLEFCINNPLGPPIDTIRPSIPTLQPASNITSTSVDLSWTNSTDNLGVLNYTLFYNDTFTTVYSGNNFTLTGLSSNTNYDVEVYAADGQGNFSQKGNSISFTTLSNADTDPPTTPLNLLASNIGSTSFDLSWTASTDNIGVDHYEIYVDNALNSTSNINAGTITAVNPNTTYSCYVVAVDAAGNRSANSSILNVTTLPVSNSCGTGPLNLTITFDANPELIGWLIQDVNGNFVALNAPGTYSSASPGSTITETISSIAQGDYLFTMIAAGGDGICCANGNGNFILEDSQNNVLATGSNFAFTKLVPICIGSSNGFVFDLTPPTDPVLSASNVTTSTVDLSWTPSYDASTLFGYAIYRDGIYIGDVYNNQTSVTVPNLSSNTTYTFNVLSRDIWFNFSNFSNTETITTLSAGPTSVLIHEGYFETGWDGWIDGGNDCVRYSGNNSPEGIYSIRLRDDSGFKSSMTSQDFDLSAFDSVKIDFEYRIRGFEMGEDFWIRYDDGINGWNTIKTFTRGVEFSGNGFYSASVLLEKPSYDLTSNAKFRFQADASENNDRVWIDAVVITGYMSASNNAAFAAESSGQFNEFLSLQAPVVQNSDAQSNEQTLKSSFKVYPNPATQYIVPTFTENQGSYEIYDLNGSVLMRGKIKAKIDVSNLPAGLYYFQLKDKNGLRNVASFVKK